MTKQHFEAFAREIKASDRTDNEKAAMYYLVVRVAQQFNPRFQSQRFAEACGLTKVLR